MVPQTYAVAGMVAVGVLGIGLLAAGIRRTPGAELRVPESWKRVATAGTVVLGVFPTR